MTRLLALMAVVALAASGAAAQTKADPSLDDVLARVGAYVAAYGEKASVVVAMESYVQNTTEGDAQSATDSDGRRTTGVRRHTRNLVAEFAIVRAARGWVGFRDVVEVDGVPVRDRRDRLVALLTGQSATLSEAMRIANESARFNVGPIARNFNTPTTAMFFFTPEHLARFAFAHQGFETIESMHVMEIEFKETRKPTFIMTRAGKDVPIEGTLWVNPVDGTVIRTRMRLRNFADAITTGAVLGTLRRHTSSAEIDVTYRRPPGLELWLPATMVEDYQGPIFTRNGTAAGRATTRATYADFKQFATSTKVVPQ